PDGAVVETYFITYQRISPTAGDSRAIYLHGKPYGPDDAVETEVVGRYVDRLTRRDGAWRVQSRTVVAELMRAEPVPAGGGLSHKWALCGRNGDDPIEALRREVGLA